MTNNPNAFPMVADDSARRVEHGMSLRDYFAGQVLGRLALARVGADGIENQAHIAKAAYAIADAMLAERGA